MSATEWKNPVNRSRGEGFSSPVGVAELPVELQGDFAGAATEHTFSIGCCGGFTWFTRPTGFICVPTANGYQDPGCLV